MEQIIKCPYCKTEFETQPEVCDNCVYPFSATEKERSKFVAQQILKKGAIEDAKENIAKSRIVLFILAGVNIIFPFFLYLNSPFGTIAITMSVFIGLIFLMFGIFLNKKPMLFISLSLGFLITLYLLELLIAPPLFFKGLLWKGVFVAVLGFSFGSVVKSNKMLKGNFYQRKG